MQYGPRTRVDNTVIPDSYTTLTGKMWDGGDSIPVTAQRLTRGVEETRIMTDVVDYQYKRRQAAGEIFNNPMYSKSTFGGIVEPTRFDRRNLTKDSDGHIYGYDWTDGSASFGDQMPDYLPLPEAFDVQYMRDKAVTQAYGNRSLVIQAASMTLAEGKKTIQSCYEIIFRVAEIALAVKRLDFKHLADELSPGELKNRYMELRYAIRPLLIDAENVVKAYNAHLGKSRKTARGGASERIVVSDTCQNYYYSGTHTESSRTSMFDVEVRAGVLCDVDASKLSIWGADQLIETVWEVIPFSFIFGWFFDFASLIGSWSPKVGVRELASWVTTTITSQQTVDSRLVVDPDPTYWIQENTWTGKKTLTTVERWRDPNPNKSIWPSLDIKLDTLKIIDLGVILSGILSGKITKLMR